MIVAPEQMVWALWYGVVLVCGLIAGMTVFPQPLNPDEERLCLAGMKDGDAYSRDRLIEHNLRLVAHIVKKFDNTGEQVDDLISIGTVGLIKGIETFDPAKGTRLATYAARCIENEILMYLRTLRRNRTEVSLFEPIGVDKEGNEITLLDILGSDPDLVPDQVDSRFERAELRRVLRVLHGKERMVVILRYGLAGDRRLTQREIAGRLGISRSYVSRIDMPETQRGNSQPYLRRQNLTIMVWTA